MSFSSEVSRFVKKAKGQTDEAYRQVVFQLWTDAVQGTPRITGTLRANWQIGIETLNARKLEPDQGINGKDAVQNLKIENRAFVYNNMEYAEVVENGLDGTARVPRRMLANAINASKVRGQMP